MNPYCPTCRAYFYHIPGQATCPPYAVIHVVATEEHLHPITRVPMDVQEPA